MSLLATRRRVRIVLASTAAVAALAQIPPSTPLTPGSSEALHAEVRRVERMLETGGDRGAVTYALARTWAAGGQYKEALRVLEGAIGLRVGLDPEQDRRFARLQGTREFARILQRVRADTPPVLHGRLAFTIPEADLVPEGIAYDPVRKRFFVGSLWKRKVVECTVAGVCRTFADGAAHGLGEVLGLRTDPRDGTLWAASNSAAESGVFHYSGSGKLIRKYTLIQPKQPHMFNDLVVSRAGDVFVTDSLAGTVYWVHRGTERLEVFDPSLKITAANGIAIAEQGGVRLFVAGFPNGITVVDVASRSFRPLRHAADVCLATIDGLYFDGGDLFAVQNAIMVERVVRLRLTADLEGVESLDVLERRGPLLDGPTTGAIDGGTLFVLANPQVDMVENGKLRAGVRPDPVRVVRVELGRGR